MPYDKTPERIWVILDVRGVRHVWVDHAAKDSIEYLRAKGVKADINWLLQFVTLPRALPKQSRVYWNARVEEIRRRYSEGLLLNTNIEGVNTSE